jgi:SAM-dependent methyltransferase
MTLERATRSADLRADRAYLAHVAYADDSGLRDRVSLYDHQEPRIDLIGETLSRLGELEGQTVGDIGCGNGAYLSALAAAGAAPVGLDLSAGMLTAVPVGSGLLAVADAQCLPIRTASLDGALAMHMLYHVPDPALAVREARRVLRSGGHFVTAVGGPDHLIQARAVWSGLARDAGLSQELQDLGLTNTRLSVSMLEEILRGYFPEVHLSTLRSQVVLRDPAALERFASSTTTAKLAMAHGTDMPARLGAAVDKIIAAEGAFHVTTEVALFAALGRP